MTVISMLGAIMIWFGGNNVFGAGWSAWNIAAFTIFFSCYQKLAVKSSKAAKLFNAGQKAQVEKVYAPALWELMHFGLDKQV